MRFNVAQLVKEGVGSTRSSSISESITHGAGLGDRVVGEVRLLHTDRSIWVSANLETWVSVTCSRCLKETRQRLTLPIQEEYLPTVDIVTGQPLSVEERKESVFPIGTDQVLSLEEAVRQYVIACTPMKPLCRPDCPGLCPKCGADLSQNPCSCRKEALDPQWGPLASLLKGD